jgi:site-specific DNA-cytosine methylase
MSQIHSGGALTYLALGPPCPGFTIANRFPKAEDIRNSLIILYLSLLDFYRPTYFLLENVEGMLNYRVSSIIRSLLTELLMP